MKKPVIEVNNVSKRYMIGAQQQTTLRELLATQSLKLFNRSPKQQATQETELWALKDLNFSVQKGEVVGFIGANGAGKSTLLKLLSRIIYPTEGTIHITGRVASLLEVGTGFHPELTGRENIYLNGIVLGMKRQEIQRKFDEIVAFSEVEKFIDTPVKRYSSGMYMRLAFAVAAHVEPDVLIVDEVLAVGDAAFQRKSLGKMNAISGEGRTVLFVSHNLTALTSLCTRAVLLDHGHVRYEGDVQDTINKYVKTHNLGNQAERVWEPDEAPGKNTRLLAARVKSEGNITNNVSIDEDIVIEIDYRNDKPGALLIPVIHLRDQHGAYILVSGNMHSANLGHDPWFDKPHPVGLYRSRVILPGKLLNTGRYYIDVGMGNERGFEFNEEWLLFIDVHESGSMTKELTSSWVGVIRLRLDWVTEKVE